MVTRLNNTVMCCYQVMHATVYSTLTYGYYIRLNNTVMSGLWEGGITKYVINIVSFCILSIWAERRM